MWAKRIGAVVLAAILIGGAVLLRRAVTGGSDSPTTEPPDLGLGGHLHPGARVGLPRARRR